MSELIREENEEQVQERPPFEVNDDQKAEWCLEQIKRKKEELEKWRAHYDAMFDRVRRTIESDIVWFEGNLKAYFIQMDNENLTRSTKTQKAYDLPHGKLVLKKQEPEYVRDDEQILLWLNQNAPEFVKTKESVDWAGMKKTYTVVGDAMVTDQGEVVPGIKVNDREDIFKVEVK